MRDLSQRLFAAEVASENAAVAHIHPGVRVCEKLRNSLTRFAGADGFTSLLRRSLALAREDVPALNAVQLQPDGSLDGLGTVAADATNGGPEAAVAITAHLLGLLVTFIGEPLTLRLIREAWPEVHWTNQMEDNEAL